mmetsp:Transcript_3959/g.10892  ORF Transcript_3959/g.10892 Transcript_3959/m.10892 type:complete len:109 (-) Transcript_3959:1321-1647(-)
MRLERCRGSTQIPSSTQSYPNLTPCMCTVSGPIFSRKCILVERCAHCDGSLLGLLHALIFNGLVLDPSGGGGGGAADCLLNLLFLHALQECDSAVENHEGAHDLRGSN